MAAVGMRGNQHFYRSPLSYLALCVKLQRISYKNGKVKMEKRKLIENEEMRAVCITSDNGVELKKVPVPKRAEPGHLVIKMEACGINPGDKSLKVRGSIKRP